MEGEVKLNFAAAASSLSGTEQLPLSVGGSAAAHRPAARPAAYFHNATGLKLSPWAARATVRRRRKLEQFDELIAGGTSKRRAAELLGVSYTSIWRWRKRVYPLTSKCGRKSLATRLELSAMLLNRVRSLQVEGLSNRAAWRKAAEQPWFPEPLAELLAWCDDVPGCLLNATRLRRRCIEVKKRVVLYTAPGFFHQATE